jgi:REP element-mobilizing transposase RayT
MMVMNMPREAREKSETGIYHIIIRGANRQEIFHDDEDRIRFLETFERYKNTTKMKVYGWCLMGNHAHLLLEEGSEELSVTMKRIGVSYVWYYNWRYKTTGHLFQDRFKSEKVEKDDYLLTVIRYIHQNPLKAGMVKRIEEWKWSSCLEYYGERSHYQNLLDSKLILEIFSKDKDIAVIRFKEFNEAKNEDKCLEDNKRIRLTDDEAKEEIKKFIPKLQLAQVKSLPKEKRDEVIIKLKGIEGVTQRQLARILGISPNLVFKA